MLNKGVDEILFNASGVAWGVRTGSEYAKAKYIIGDPSYFPTAMTRVTGKVSYKDLLLDLFFIVEII